MPRFSSIIPLLFCLLITGCGFVHDEHIIGSYRLIAVDTGSQSSISYDLGNGSSVGRINKTVFAYGFDQRYIVAKQHPDGRKSITNYFYLNMKKDSKYAEPSASVTGPLTQKEFEAQALKLKLPKFTRTLKNLQ